MLRRCNRFPAGSNALTALKVTATWAQGHPMAGNNSSRAGCDVIGDIHGHAKRHVPGGLGGGPVAFLRHARCHSIAADLNTTLSDRTTSMLSSAGQSGYSSITP